MQLDSRTLQGTNQNELTGDFCTRRNEREFICGGISGSSARPEARVNKPRGTSESSTLSLRREFLSHRRRLFFLKFDFRRVPDTFQLGAISPCPAFLASRKINNLRVFNPPQYSNSPRLQAVNFCVINGLDRISFVHVPLMFNASDSALLIEGLQGVRSTSSAIMPFSSTRVSAF